MFSLISYLSFYQSCSSLFSRGDLATAEDVLKNAPAVLNQVDTPGWSGLHYAVHAHHLDVVEFLLKKNADPNTLNGAGETPLAIAVVKNYPEYVRLLIEAGADAKIVNRQNLSSYDLAPNDEIRSALLGNNNAVSSGYGYLVHKEESDSE